MTLLPKGKKAHYAIFSFKYFVNDYPPYCTLYSMQCTALFFLTKNIVSKGFFSKNGLVMFFPLHISVIVIFYIFI